MALSAPVATAMPDRDKVGTTAALQHDPRGVDTRGVCVRPQTGTPASDGSVNPQTGTATLSEDRSADARDAEAKPAKPVPGLPTWPVDPEPIAPAPIETTPVAGDDDTPPLVYILPGIALSLLLAAGLAYAVRNFGPRPARSDQRLITSAASARPAGRAGADPPIDTGASSEPPLRAALAHSPRDPGCEAQRAGNPRREGRRQKTGSRLDSCVEKGRVLRQRSSALALDEQRARFS